MSLRSERAEAEERSRALLRSIVPAEAFDDDEGCIRVTSEQSGQSYRIYLGQISENIIRDEDGRNYCGGPWVWQDYGYMRDGYLEIDDRKFAPMRKRALEEGTTPLHLPNGDVHLAQYLALRYDEEAFLEKANW